MGPQILIPISLFLMIFGIVYLIFSTRNRERLALIEKGIDASIFLKGSEKGVPAWKIFVVNLAFLLIGSGVGIFLALLITTYTGLNDGAVYPSIIFIMSGVGLLAGFKTAKDLDKE
ncbi:DUF6249 domain-containing protein [Flavobacterium hercynium]|jgi:hypothetical protein|uniref:DUF6249 domain-containing protein n=1 Tax=Flavobacterium hercynium TaxID=387094 RepID=A0A226HJ97_9FLAO|nr:DUF6249 domain-containing protein [Flavobacterium hercynium]OXA94343.1 hypothetical protein B0A66_04615 [Flavobacterium hercynium]PAM92388.1 hypothetical protein B4N84_26685 [Flavobacterium sp. IR1]SMP29038.1 hypothetical protein SAMN06265346_11211 [Flavobacterium hercynium]